MSSRAAPSDEHRRDVGVAVSSGVALTGLMHGGGGDSRMSACTRETRREDGSADASSTSASTLVPLRLRQVNPTPIMPIPSTARNARPPVTAVESLSGSASRTLTAAATVVAPSPAGGVEDSTSTTGAAVSATVGDTDGIPDGIPDGTAVGAAVGGTVGAVVVHSSEEQLSVLAWLMISRGPYRSPTSKGKEQDEWKVMSHVCPPADSTMSRFPGKAASSSAVSVKKSPTATEVGMTVRPAPFVTTTGDAPAGPGELITSASSGCFCDPSGP
mmetsp:Transcript_17480/g.51772  ORF Transcript_17480/g.51772 Transcript_17480/m.51772 type:complete len:272 (-) Transcript_17480:310-1125(-)